MKKTLCGLILALTVASLAFGGDQNTRSPQEALNQIAPGVYYKTWTYNFTSASDSTFEPPFMGDKWWGWSETGACSLQYTSGPLKVAMGRDVAAAADTFKVGSFSGDNKVDQTFSELKAGGTFFEQTHAGAIRVKGNGSDSGTIQIHVLGGYLKSLRK